MKECPHFRSAGHGGPPRGRDRREPGEVSLGSIPGRGSKLRERPAPDALRQEPPDLLGRLAVPAWRRWREPQGERRGRRRSQAAPGRSLLLRYVPRVEEDDRRLSSPS